MLMELQEPASHKVVPLRDQRDLHRKSCREADIVGVHPCHHLVLARRQADVQRVSKTDVVGERHHVDRDGRAGNELIDSRLEPRRDDAVPHKDNLVRPERLILDRACEGTAQVIGIVGVIRR